MSLPPELRPVVRVCAWCRQNRRETAMAQVLESDEWRPVPYLFLTLAESSALASHGLCPECSATAQSARRRSKR